MPKNYEIWIEKNTGFGPPGSEYENGNGFYPVLSEPNKPVLTQHWTLLNSWNFKLIIYKKNNKDIQ